MQGENKFKDELGRVIVSEDYIERTRSDEDDWEEVTEQFDSEAIVDKIHYSKIEEIDFQPETRLPVILIKTDGCWRRLPLESPEQAEKVYKRLRYRYQAYLQNH